MAKTLVIICVPISFCLASIPGWRSGEVSEILSHRLKSANLISKPDPLVKPWDDPDLQYMLANDYRDYLESDRAVEETTKKGDSSPNPSTKTSAKGSETEGTTLTTEIHKSTGLAQAEAKTKAESSDTLDTLYEDDDEMLDSLNETVSQDQTTFTQNQTQEVGSDNTNHMLLNNDTAKVKPTIKAPDKDINLDDLLSVVEETSFPTTAGPTTRGTTSTSNEASRMESCLPKSYRLKGIRSFITPELLNAMASSSVGDYVLLAANDFPTNAIRRDGNGPLLVVQLAGLPMDIVLREILRLWPISGETEVPVIAMTTSGTDDRRVQDRLRVIINEAQTRDVAWHRIHRKEFLNVAKGAEFVIQTGEPGLGTTIMIRRGAVGKSPAQGSNSVLHPIPKADGPEQDLKHLAEQLKSLT